MSRVEAVGDSGEFVAFSKRTMKLITAEARNFAERLAAAEAKLQEMRDLQAITEAELQLVRDQRDDLLRRATAAKSIWNEVEAPPDWPTAEGS